MALDLKEEILSNQIRHVLWTLLASSIGEIFNAEGTEASPSDKLTHVVEKFQVQKKFETSGKFVGLIIQWSVVMRRNRAAAVRLQYSANVSAEGLSSFAIKKERQWVKPREYS